MAYGEGLPLASTDAYGIQWVNHYFKLYPHYNKSATYNWKKLSDFFSVLSVFQLLIFCSKHMKQYFDTSKSQQATYLWKPSFKTSCRKIISEQLAFMPVRTKRFDF